MLDQDVGSVLSGSLIITRIRLARRPRANVTITRGVAVRGIGVLDL